MLIMRKIVLFSFLLVGAVAQNFSFAEEAFRRCYFPLGYEEVLNDADHPGQVMHCSFPVRVLDLEYAKFSQSSVAKTPAGKAMARYFSLLNGGDKQKFPPVTKGIETLYSYNLGQEIELWKNGGESGKKARVFAEVKMGKCHGFIWGVPPTAGRPYSAMFCVLFRKEDDGKWYNYRYADRFIPRLFCTVFQDALERKKLEKMFVAPKLPFAAETAIDDFEEEMPVEVKHSQNPAPDPDALCLHFAGEKITGMAPAETPGKGKNAGPEYEFLHNFYQKAATSEVRFGRDVCFFGGFIQGQNKPLGKVWLNVLNSPCAVIESRPWRLFLFAHNGRYAVMQVEYEQGKYGNNHCQPFGAGFLNHPLRYEPIIKAFEKGAKASK